MSPACPPNLTQTLRVLWQPPGIATGSQDQCQRRWRQTALTTKQDAQARVELATQTQGTWAVARERRKWANSGSPGRREENGNHARMDPTRPLPTVHLSRRTSGKRTRDRQEDENEKLRQKGSRGGERRWSSAGWRQREGGSVGGTHRAPPSTGLCPRSAGAKGGWTERRARSLPARRPPPWRWAKMARDSRTLAGQSRGCRCPRAATHWRRWLRPPTKICRRAAAARQSVRPSDVTTAAPRVGTRVVTVVGGARAGRRRLGGAKGGRTGCGQGAPVGAEPRAGTQAVSRDEGRSPEGSARRCCGWRMKPLLGKVFVLCYA